jgi:hypothetical protein
LQATNTIAKATVIVSKNFFIVRKSLVMNRILVF